MPNEADHSAADFTRWCSERQITREPRNHVLTNLNVWSPDGARIVFDLRPDDGFNGTEIAEVNWRSGGITTLYVSQNGAHCGVATYSPTGPWVAFMLGPEHPSGEWQYGMTRRRGVLVDAGEPKGLVPIDAMNYAPPFTPGALRGGSHVHVFSPDGKWISFTYEDDVLERLGNRGDHDLNQRNVAVAFPAVPVQTGRNHPRNHDGSYFSVVVTRTVNSPAPGSDEISRAFEDGWIGTRGYRRSSGAWQKRALAFQGLVTAPDGSRHAEVFIVDLPEDATISGAAPIEGTDRRYPAPPLGAVQRRLTFSSAARFPGVAAAPRHWLRSAPDGSQIAFLRKDDTGLVQLWLVSPNGGESRQLSRHRWDIASTLSWSPDGRWIAHIMDNSVFITEVATGLPYRLTRRTDDAYAPLALACVFSPDGRHLAYLRAVEHGARRFNQIFVAALERLPA